ncbi:MAG: nicotinate (nicotinamide) nucleotide adenylyltransferase [Clostridia bacterium]|nr:nicotinate (nicotinamide) nucleotide adenylyltransferase [Clostridia bacterium]
MAIGIFGGTFNPPHLGHLRLLRAFADRFSLSRVLVIPTFVPPHKLSPDLADAGMRLEMCRMLFDDHRFTVSDLEIARGGKSYTVETLETLRAQYPGEALYLLIGSDMLESFDTWYRADDIRRLCTVCAAVREKGKTLDPNGAVLLENFDPIEISSTAVREKVRLGEDAAPYVGEAVGAFIRGKGLYADAYTQYRRLLREKLGAYRLRHSFCVADSAKALAQQYGEDPQKAYFAGLLHDVMKDAPRDEQKAVIERGGTVLGADERANPKLWHAMAGEAFLRTELSVADEDVLHAVRYHTTGRAGMSLLEKIIYVSDYLSEDRVYDGVDRMRRLASESLESAMLFGLSFTISELAKSEQPIHPDSVACYNEIVLNNNGKDRSI